jgi:signal transduction histidine kinase
MNPMNQSQLFHRTRWRLTGCYVGVMATILSLVGVTFYSLMAQTHWHALHRELESVAGTLHDGLEPNLQEPGQLSPRAQQILPGLCMTGATCTGAIAERHVLGAIQQDGYYARLLTRSGQLLATVGHQPEQLPFVGGDQLWQTLPDRRGRPYHHISLLLKTVNHQPWGYLQVGRSLQEFDHYLATTRGLLWIGLPITMLLVTGASWWLAGLAMRPVYQSYQQIQQFTADVAHELRTPLAATQATLESALEIAPLAPLEAHSTLQTLDRQNHRLIQLVQDLLLLSRMDQQGLPPKHQRVKLNALIADVVDEFESLAIAAKLHLKTEIFNHQAITVLGDAEQLYRLVANLVINAIQYTPPGGCVTLRLQTDEPYAVIQVQDTGIGIPEPEQRRIFDRFYRINRDRARHTGGAGLGLAIAQAIAIAHHGTIQVNSQTGQGSSFRVQLLRQTNNEPRRK